MAAHLDADREASAAAARDGDEREAAALVLYGDKSGNGSKWRCPTPVVGRAFELPTGERIAIPCGRNGCPVCRRRNVRVTGAMFALSVAADVEPPTHALTTTTYRWLSNAELRETTAQFVRRVRGELAPAFEYAWVREWTTGEAPRSGGIRRTHYHWLPKRVPPAAIPTLLRVASEVWRRRSGAPVVDVKPLWDVGGFGRYMAGLVGHHLKAAQRPPDGWRGRRTGTSRGFYSRPASELRARAEALVREDGLLGRLERDVAGGREWPDFLDGPILDLFDAELEAAYVHALAQPPPAVVPVPRDYWLREAA